MVDGPLSSVRVLDLTHIWAGPLGVRFLADLGADVVMVEAPYARGPRQQPDPPIGGWLGGVRPDDPWNANAMFAKLHRNRRSVCLDMKQAGAREVMLDLVAAADVLVENFSAPAMANMGLDAEVLAERNPQLINVSLPGYGALGPYRERVAFGLTAESMSGLTEVMAYAPGEGRNSTMALMDPMTATHAAAGILAALRRRAATGRGQRLEITLHESGLALTGPFLIDHQLGASPTAAANGHPRMAPHGIYPAAGEDQWVAIACTNDEMWRALSELIGAEANQNLSQRQARLDVIEAQIEAWTIARSKFDTAELLQAAGVAAAPVSGAADLLAEEHATARGFFRFQERGGVRMPGNPLQMGDHAVDDWSACPELGEHNEAVMEEWLGTDAESLPNGLLLKEPPG